jgi:hypothetical protein
MTCEIQNVINNIQQHPCTKEATDRNWDALKKILNGMMDNIVTLQGCVTEPVIDATGSQPFQLTEDLPLGGEAAAVKLTYVAGAWVPGTAITVKDGWPCGGKFWGFTGDIGFAWNMPGTAIYIVFQMQTRARWVRYTLDETLNGLSAVATLNHYWQGCNPANGAGKITVYDPRGFYKKWHCKLCKGLAVWNERNARYEIVDAQLMAKFYKATLDADLCVSPPETDPEVIPASIPDEAGVTIVSRYVQGYYSALPYDTANNAIAAVVAKNPFGHVAPAPYTVLLMASDDGAAEDEIQFTIVDIKKNIKYTLDPEAPFSFAAPCGVSANVQYSAIEACDSAEGAVLPYPFTVVDMVDSFEVLHGYSPETCSIVAHTKKYCVIDREEAGADKTVAAMQKMEVVTDWYLDLNDPGDYQYYDIKVSVDNAWVVCTSEGSEVPVHRLRRQDIIDSFTHTDEDSPEDCKLTANTKETWVFKLPDPTVDGDDIPVITFEKQEVLNDIDVNSSALYQDTIFIWVPCSKLGNTVSVISTSECPAP